MQRKRKNMSEEEWNEVRIIRVFKSNFEDDDIIYIEMKAMYRKKMYTQCKHS